MYLSKKHNTWYVTPARDIVLRKSLPVCLFIFLLAVAGSAQPTNKNYPLQFSQFMFGYPMINPSSIGVNANNEIVMGYQRPVTGFSGVSTYFCSLSFLPYKPGSTAKSKSIIGFRFYNDIEGAYISRMRFYGMYAFHTRINSRLMFSGGIDFGGMNFSVKATPTTEGASVFKPDANTGIWLYNEVFHLGFSVNQLFNSVFQPIDERTVLPTYCNLTASYRVLNSKIAEIRPHLLITSPYYGKTSIQMGLYGLFFKKLITAVAWNHKTSLSAMLGLHDLEIYKSHLNLILSYCTSVHRVALGINKLEISVLYAF